MGLLKHKIMSYKLQDYIWVSGFKFELKLKHSCYDCRGEILYDNEHDQIPEPALWAAAHELASILLNNGIYTEVSHSEKGWVEVVIIKTLQDE